MSSSFFEEIDLNANNSDLQPYDPLYSSADLTCKKKKGEEEIVDISISSSTIIPSFHFDNNDSYYEIYGGEKREDGDISLDITNTTSFLLGEKNISNESTFKNNKNQPKTKFDDDITVLLDRNSTSNIGLQNSVVDSFRQRSATGTVRIGGNQHSKNRHSLSSFVDNPSFINPLVNVFNGKRTSFIEGGREGEEEGRRGGEEGMKNESIFSNWNEHTSSRKMGKQYRIRSEYEMEILNSRKKILDEELKYCYLDIVNTHAEMSQSQSIKEKETEEIEDSRNKLSKVAYTNSTLIIRVGKSKRILDSLSLTAPKSKTQREQTALMMFDHENGPLIDQINTKNSEYDAKLVKLEWYRLGPQTKGQFQPILMSEDQPFGSYNCSPDDVGCTICLRATVRNPKQFVPIKVFQVKSSKEEGQTEGSKKTKLVYKDDDAYVDNTEYERKTWHEEEEEIQAKWENEKIRGHFKEKRDGDIFYNEDEVAEIIKYKGQDDENNDLDAYRTAFVEIGPILVEEHIEKTFMEKMSIFSAPMEKNNEVNLKTSSLAKHSEGKVLSFRKLTNPFVPRMYYDLELYEEKILLYQYPLSNSIYHNSSTSNERRRTLVTRGRYMISSKDPTSLDAGKMFDALSCISLLSSSLLKQYYEIASNDSHPQQERLEVGQGKKVQTLIEQGILSEGFLLQILPEKRNQASKETKNAYKIGGTSLFQTEMKKDSNTLHPDMVSNCTMC